MGVSMILIIDCGSQLSQNIARRVRENNVFCKIVPYNSIKNVNELINNHEIIEGIIISGGPHSVYDNNSPKIDREIFNLNIPILGICYGMQLIAYSLNGVVKKDDKREYGRTKINIISKSKIFEGINDELNVWMSHGDSINELPPNFKLIAKSNFPAAIENEEKKIYALQFHPESDHSEFGRKILSNFLNICGCKKDWKMSNFIEDEIKSIKELVKDDFVIGGVSGGVDSTTGAFLLNKAIGEQFIPIFINNGLLRLNEAEEVISTFKKFNIKLNYIDATEEFLNNLKDVSDPEKKRKIIGKTFIDIFEREANKIKNAKYLMQGTLYPDIVESVPIYGSSSIIKSHHNVGGLPEKLNLKLIEPFKFLFKDEVREIAKELNVPEIMWKRHPFPGPGLAVRIIGVIDEEKLNLLKKADKIFIEELLNNNIYNEIWQALVALLPIKSVGVMGDEKSYEFVCTLRAVTSKDGMTADWYRMDHEIIEKIANRILNEVKGINRVLYDVSSKPPATIEYE
jgi:GMP synthase (glutamine-hydrolysing)